METTSLLTVTNLQKSFGGVQAVRDVSFTLARGQMLALIGPNGAGKSTTFNCLNGQIIPDSGEVLYHPNITARPVSLVGLAPHKVWRLGVGRTFQITATFASMSVIENVQMVLINHHGGLKNLWKRARQQYEAEALELLKQVGLETQADLACGVLAYGDLKRLELAIALAHEPQLLLMDEPTAGMGMEERLALMELTRKLARAQNIGVLFTEHDMDVVFGFADHIVVMHRGRTIASGTPEAIRIDPEVKRVYLGEDLAMEATS